MRNVLIHCHMFKNAGSSLDWSLQRSFGSDFIDHRDDADMRSRNGYLKNYLLDNSSIKALSSHHITMPLPELSGVNLFPVFLFRNPLERIGSVYEFEKKQEANTPGSINAKKLNFSDYVRWRMEENSGATIRDFQTRCCIGSFAARGVRLTDDDFEEAKKIVSETKLIGLVEKYNQSMVLFEDEMKEYSPALNLAYVRQNVNQSLSLTTDDKIDRIFRLLDTDATELLLDHNKYDLLLYNYARSVFCKRMDGIIDLEKKLDGFNVRCSKL